MDSIHDAEIAALKAQRDLHSELYLAAVEQNKTLLARIAELVENFSAETTRANQNWLEIETLRAENWNLKERIAELEAGGREE